MLYVTYKNKSVTKSFEFITKIQVYYTDISNNVYNAYTNSLLVKKKLFKTLTYILGKRHFARNYRLQICKL